MTSMHIDKTRTLKAKREALDRRLRLKASRDQWKPIQAVLLSLDDGGYHSSPFFNSNRWSR